MTTGGLFLYRRLEQLLPGVLGRRYRELNFENGSIVPTQADLEAGAAEVVRDTVNEVGDADIVAGDAFDIPVVDISADEDRYKIFMIASAFSYTFQDERNYEKAGNAAQLNNRKMMLARRSIAERHNRIAAYGDTRVNVTGFLNNASVPLNNSSFDPHSGTTTADELTSFFIDEVKSLHTNSNNVEMPSDCLVSTGLYFKLIKTRMPDSSMTALDYVKKALSENGMDFNIMKSQECDSANLEARGVQSGGTNKDRVVLYPKEEEVVERHIELTQLMPNEWVAVKNGRRVYPMFSCTTATIINFPNALRYIDVAKEA